ncbi:4-(cytidine 5'-diphospho)-2-C-methyl-D-erythritol kinase [Rhodovibrionaceae bacterium A322]
MELEAESAVPKAVGDGAVFVQAAPAKINLSLQIIGKRRDGYHLLDSLVAFAAVGDDLSVAESDQLSLAVRGPFASLLENESDNLVLRAARLLAEVANRPARAAITLEKRLPVAAGIGGGSSDAAAALLALNDLWQLDYSLENLMDLGAALGADVPVCLYGSPAVMRGIGEDIQAAPILPPAWLLLVNPGVGLATATVFRARPALFSSPPRWREINGFDTVADLADGLSDAGNDLESTAASLCPEIDEVLSALASLPGCELARMSGSGATCFGLFGGGEDARLAAEALRSLRPNWWIQASPLLGPRA